MSGLREAISGALARHPEYTTGDDGADACSGCFARLEPDGDSHAGSLAGLVKHQSDEVVKALGELAGGDFLGDYWKGYDDGERAEYERAARVREGLDRLYRSEVDERPIWKEEV